MVLETVEQTGERFGVVNRIARQLGIGTESLRARVRQAELDGGQRPVVKSGQAERIQAVWPRCGPGPLPGSWKAKEPPLGDSSAEL
jgi:hypothetical protein